MAKKILVVDDEEDIVDMLQAILEMQGYQVVGAYNGTDGLLLTRLESPDLIILDMMLPDIQGYEVCRQLRANPPTEKLPVIILSARTSQEAIELGKRAGANVYMTKPVQLPQFFAHLQRLLQEFPPV
jgi:DNA-binding response OmpR family regulator